MAPFDGVAPDLGEKNLLNVISGDTDNGFSKVIKVGAVGFIPLTLEPSFVWGLL